MLSFLQITRANQMYDSIPAAAHGHSVYLVPVAFSCGIEVITDSLSVVECINVHKKTKANEIAMQFQCDP